MRWVLLIPVALFTLFLMPFAAACACPVAPFDCATTNPGTQCCNNPQDGCACLAACTPAPTCNCWEENCDGPCDGWICPDFGESQECTSCGVGYLTMPAPGQFQQDPPCQQLSAFCFCVPDTTCPGGSTNCGTPLAPLCIENCPGYFGDGDPCDGCTCGSGTLNAYSYYNNAWTSTTVDNNKMQCCAGANGCVNQGGNGCLSSGTIRNNWNDGDLVCSSQNWYPCTSAKACQQKETARCFPVGPTDAEHEWRLTTNPPSEVCGDGVDNNCDGTVDCAVSADVVDIDVYVDKFNADDNTAGSTPNDVGPLTENQVAETDGTCNGYVTVWCEITDKDSPTATLDGGACTQAWTSGANWVGFKCGSRTGDYSTADSHTAVCSDGSDSMTRNFKIMSDPDGCSADCSPRYSASGRFEGTSQQNMYCCGDNEERYGQQDANDEYWNWQKLSTDSDAAVEQEWTGRTKCCNLATDCSDQSSTCRAQGFIPTWAGQIDEICDNGIWYECNAGTVCDSRQGNTCYQQTAGVYRWRSTTPADVCDGIDNDCNGGTADGSSEAWYGNSCDGADSDQCEEGTYYCNSGSQACSDTTGNNVEVCDGADNDCDGSTDEGLPFDWYYYDWDNDNYGTSTRLWLCTPSGHYTAPVSGDCDDSRALTNPLNSERHIDAECRNQHDDDCDGEVDYDTLNTPPRGDSNCPVGVSSCAASDTTPDVGEQFTISCPLSTPTVTVNSIEVSTAGGGGSCAWSGWNGLTAEFLCSFSSDGAKTVTCGVDTAKSYQIGSDRDCSINVQAVSCPGGPATRDCGDCGTETQVCVAPNWVWPGTCVGDTGNYTTETCFAGNGCDGTCQNYCQIDGTYPANCDPSCTTSDVPCDHDCNPGTPDVCQAPPCPPCGETDCNNGLDDDGDTWVDEADVSCPITLEVTPDPVAASGALTATTTATWPPWESMLADKNICDDAGCDGTGGCAGSVIPGCVGTLNCAFTAPGTPGPVTYWACVGENSDSDTISVSDFVCTGADPDPNANYCPGDDTGLPSNLPKDLVASCTPTKCEFICDAGWIYNATTDQCDLDTSGFVCTGPDPDPNATICPGDDTGLPSDLPKDLVAACTPTKCEYVCDAGFVYNATTDQCDEVSLGSGICGDNNADCPNATGVCEECDGTDSAACGPLEVCSGCVCVPAPPIDITGEVLEAVSQDGIPGATVTVVSPPPGFLAVTGFDGSYAINGVPAGRRYMSAAKPGYRSVTVELDLLPPGPHTVNFNLSDGDCGECADWEYRCDPECGGIGQCNANGDVVPAVCSGARPGDWVLNTAGTGYVKCCEGWEMRDRIQGTITTAGCMDDLAKYTRLLQYQGGQIELIVYTWKPCP